MNPVWHFLDGLPRIGPLTITTSAVTSTVPFVGPASATVPIISASTDTTSGFGVISGVPRVIYQGTTIYRFNNAAFSIDSDSASIVMGASSDVALSRAAADVLTTPDRFVSTGPTAGIGYATGAGGAVVQGSGSGKATTVVLNTVTGTITMDGAALNAATIVSFTLTNSAIASTDQVQIQHVSGGTVGAYGVTAIGGSGSGTVYVRNNTAGNLSEAIVLKFMVFKSVVA